MLCSQKYFYMNIEKNRFLRYTKRKVLIENEKDKGKLEDTIQNAIESIAYQSKKFPEEAFQIISENKELAQRKKRSG